MARSKVVNVNGVIEEKKVDDMFTWNNFMKWTMPLTLIALVIVLAAPPADAGKSKKWMANNNSDKTVKVFWISDDCDGVEPRCKRGESEDAVCKAEILEPGQSASHRFEAGGSRPRKKVCRTDGKARKRVLDSTINRTKNGIRMVNGKAEWYDE